MRQNNSSHVEKQEHSLPEKFSVVFAVAVTSLTLFSSMPSVAAENDSDNDGLTDTYELKIGTEPFLSDTDGDGINDKIEVGNNLEKPLDSDGDNVINALDFDDDNDGLPTILESAIDTDKDGLANNIDIDSDNDGISDGIEAGMLGKDENFDMIDDAFDTQQAGAKDENGDGINDLLKLPDSNGNGIPDYLDATSQKTAQSKPKQTVEQKIVTEIINKEIESVKDQTPKDLKKVVEVKQTVIAEKKPLEEQKVKTVTVKIPKNRVVLNRHTDTDNDGLLDSQEILLGTDPKKRDTDGDQVSDAIEIGLDINNPQDTDEDGIIDALDNDDDNDGVLTKNEDVNNDSSPINDDTDDDGIPNFLDNDDDGDKRLTLVEGSKLDSDNDGILDYLDKHDGVKDKAAVVAKKEVIPDTPEVVEIDEEKPVQTEDPALSKAAEINQEENLSKQVIDSVIEKQVAEIKPLDIANIVAINKKPEQPKLEKKEEGVLSWLESFLPD